MREWVKGGSVVSSALLLPLFTGTDCHRAALVS